MVETVSCKTLDTLHEKSHFLAIVIMLLTAHSGSKGVISVLPKTVFFEPRTIVTEIEAREIGDPSWSVGALW